MLLTGDFGKIEINILARNNSDDYWDGNWLYSNIIINIGFFKANYNCNLRTDEFALFSEQVRELLLSKSNEAKFSSMEEGLFLDLKRDLSGNFFLKGEAKSNENYKIHLIFEMVVDYLQMEQLQINIFNILRKYPVFGLQS